MFDTELKEKMTTELNILNDKIEYINENYKVFERINKTLKIIKLRTYAEIVDVWDKLNIDNFEIFLTKLQYIKDNLHIYNYFNNNILGYSFDAYGCQKDYIIEQKREQYCINMTKLVKQYYNILDQYETFYGLTLFNKYIEEKRPFDIDEMVKDTEVRIREALESRIARDLKCLSL